MKKTKKRSVHDIETPTEAKLLEGINKMPKQYASYASFSYLIGNRVSEGLGLRNTQHTADYRYHRTVKKRDSDGKLYTEKKPYYIPKLKTLEGYEVEPLAPWRIQFPEDGMITVDIRVYKRSGRPLWSKVADSFGPGEKPFADILREYVQSKQGTFYLWEYSRQTAYRQFMKHLGVPPHKLREMRATKNAVVYKFTAKDQQESMAWVDSKMPLYYESKNRQDIREKLAKQRR